MVLCALAFNLPKVFEVRLVETADGRSVPFPTELRQNRHYVLWYQCVLKLVVTGLLPLVALCYFNLRIVHVLWREQRQREQVGGVTRRWQLGAKVSLGKSF